MTFNTKNISNKEINNRFNGFTIMAWNGSHYEIVRKQNGGAVYSSYGRATNAADHIRWSDKYSQFGNIIEVWAVDKQTEDIYTLGEYV